MTGLTLALATASMPFVAAQDTVFEIVKVDRNSAFAGKLGRRIEETIVVQSGSQRYTIKIEGISHTFNTRRAQRFSVGQKVKFSGHASPKSGTVKRDDIRKV